MNFISTFFRRPMRIAYGANWIFFLAGLLSAQPESEDGVSAINSLQPEARSSVESVRHADRWTFTLPLSNLKKVDSLSGESDYYSLNTQNRTFPFIHAHYLPPGEPTKLGYKFSDSIMNVQTVSWQWRVTSPPLFADENKRGKNDSGAAIYMVFKKGFQVLILKYVYSTTLLPGTIVRKDHGYPFQRMYIVVVNSWCEKENNTWKQVTVDIQNDFKRLFNSQTCPPLRGIGLMSDGDGTNSEVVADYAQFVLRGTRN